MVFKLEEKEVATVHSGLNFTLTIVINFSLHSWNFPADLLTFFISFKGMRGVSENFPKF